MVSVETLKEADKKVRGVEISNVETTNLWVAGKEKESLVDYCRSIIKLAASVDDIAMGPLSMD